MDVEEKNADTPTTEQTSDDIPLVEKTSDDIPTEDKTSDDVPTEEKASPDISGQHEEIEMNETAKGEEDPLLDGEGTKKKPLLPDEDDKNASPMEKAFFISKYITFW